MPYEFQWSGHYSLMGCPEGAFMDGMVFALDFERPDYEQSELGKEKIILLVRGNGKDSRHGSRYPRSVQEIIQYHSTNIIKHPLDTTHFAKW